MNVKESIVSKIKQNDIAGALDDLKDIVPEDSSLTFGRLRNEFLNPPDNFNLVMFQQRLIVFVSTTIKVERKVSNPDLSFYDELCRLDFKMQTEHYMSIIPHKEIAAFLLHGDSDTDGNDIKWLSNQLIYRERKDTNNLDRDDDVITIDCSRLTSVEDVVEQLFNKYEVRDGDYLHLRNELGRKLSERVSQGNIVCILKNADIILHDERKLSAFFNDLLVFMGGHVRRKNHRNSLIFLLTNNGEAKVHPGNRTYFFWFGDAPPNRHAQSAVASTVARENQRIIDLAPINRLQCSDLTEWIDASFARPDAYQKARTLTDKVTTMIGAGSTARPYEVIQKICTDLKIDIEDKWIN